MPAEESKTREEDSSRPREWDLRRDRDSKALESRRVDSYRPQMDAKVEKTSKKASKRAQQRSANRKYDDPPPKSYVCNRCGEKGHHLQNCPTNLDPAFDNRPGLTYECALCGASGEHYNSLCPLNMDPLSINQRRKAREKKAASAVNTGRLLVDWDDEEVGVFEKANPDDGILCKNADEDVIDGRPVIYSSSVSEIRIASATNSVSMDHIDRVHREDPSTSQTVNVATDGTTKKRGRNDDESTDFSRLSISGDTVSRHTKRACLADPKIIETGDADIEDIADLEDLIATATEDQGSRIHFDYENKESKLQRKNTKKVRFEPEETNPVFDFQLYHAPKANYADYLDSSSDEEELFSLPQLPKQYNQFVTNMIEKYEALREVVHLPSNRPTALEMWKKDDQRREEKYGTRFAHERTHSLSSGSDSSLTSIEEDYNDDMIAFDENDKEKRYRRKEIFTTHSMKCNEDLDFEDA